MSVASKKVLHFMPKAWGQIMSLTADCPIEISAMGQLVPGRDNIVQEFHCVKQYCTGASTDMDKTALMQLQLDLTARGIDPTLLRVHWHSHVNMGTSPSGVDEANIDRMANGAFLWTIITNKDGAAAAFAGMPLGKGISIRLDTFDPVKHDSLTSVFRHTVSDCEYRVLAASTYRTAAGADWVKAALATVSAPNVAAPSRTNGFASEYTFDNDFVMRRREIDIPARSQHERELLHMAEAYGLLSDYPRKYAALDKPPTKPAPPPPAWLTQPSKTEIVGYWENKWLQS